MVEELHLWLTDGDSVEPVDLFEGPAGASWGEHALIDGDLYLGAWEADPEEPAVYLYPGGVGPLRRLVTGVGNVSQFTPVGERVVFRGNAGARGAEVWVTDGKPAGTSSLYDVNPGPPSSNPEQLTSLGEYALFIASEETSGPRRIWATDGSHAGTYPLFLDEAQAPIVYLIAGAADAGFFVGRNGGLDTLWVTDGTVEGTRIAKVLPPGSWVAELVAVGSGARVLANIKTPEAGTEVWLSDGSEGGTYQLTEIALGSADADPRGFVRAGNNVLFRADDGLHGVELHHLRFALTEDYVLESFGSGGSSATLSGAGAPRLFGTLELLVRGAPDGAFVELVASTDQSAFADPSSASMVFPLAAFTQSGSGEVELQLRLPGAPALLDVPLYLRAIVHNGTQRAWSNGLELLIGRLFQD